MIWRVFKKDVRLLWWMVLIMLVVRLGQGVMSFHHGVIGDLDNRQIENLLDDFVGYLASAILIMMAVYQDGLVGSTQDWLVRPIDRRLLLLAKLLFALVVVLLPYFAVKFATGVFYGISTAEALTGALVATGLAFVFLVLPALMLAAITRTLAQSLALAIGAFLIVLFSMPLAKHFGAALAIRQYPFQWQATVLEALVLVVGASVVLPLAYLRRNTLWAWIGCGVTFAGFLALHLLPFGALFAIQQAIESNPKAAETIRIVYDPTLPPSRFVGTEQGFVARNAKQKDLAAVLRGLPFALGKPWVGRHLPIRITGVPADAIVRVDYLGLRLVSADGRELYRTAEKNRFLTWLLNEEEGQSFKLYNEGPGQSERGLHQQFSLPSDIYLEIKNVPLRIEVDYAITVLGRRATAVVPALFASRSVAGVGICESRIGPDPTNMLEIWCHNASNNAHCFLVNAENAATGARNLLRDQCYPNYQPRLLAAAEALKPASPAIYLSDPAGVDKTRFPIGLDQVSTSRLTITSYGPQAHVWRHVETPLLRLRDL